MDRQIAIPRLALRGARWHSAAMRAILTSHPVSTEYICGRHPLDALPEASLAGHAALAAQPDAAVIPDDEACFALWDKYEMLDNVRAHSLLVAHIATELARRAAAAGRPVHVGAVRASALLHDLAKTYCIRHGGSHAVLGAGWVMAETHNPLIAQGVLLHVHWPWAVPVHEPDRLCSLPFFVIYADKRSMHDRCVPLEERFQDLLERYGKTEKARSGITDSYRQANLIESALEAHLGCHLHEDTFDSGRLVHGA